MNAPGRAILFAAVAVALQAAGSAEVIMRGGLIVQGAVLNADASSASAVPEPDPAGPQVLDFTNGERLHGALDALDLARGLLTWRRTDASGPLAIALPEVRRIRFENAPERDAAPMATLKFTGGDWLTGRLIAISGERIEVQVNKDIRVTTNRAHVEWIYFSKNGAAECYDGPTSLAGWTTAGGWTYREGALRTNAPGPIGRFFHSLPDRVEYRMRVDQGELVNSFAITLHGGSPAAPGFSGGVVQVTVRASSLQLRAKIDGAFQAVQADLTTLLGPPSGRPKGPMFIRVFEDITGGRILVFINDRKAAEWAIDKGEPGKNGGGFQFQPMSWSGEKEQVLSNVQVLPWDGREPAAVEPPAEDQAILARGGVKTGRITKWDGRELKIGARTLARDELTLLRFRRPAHPPEDAPPVAQVRLAGRGEFDAVALDWRDGQFLVTTNFGGEIAIPPTLLAEIEFPRAEPTTTPTGDLLVFRNGDRLRGSPETAEHAGAVRWQGEAPGPAVDFAPTQLAGLQFAARGPRRPGGMVAQFRNGDWLSGALVTLDREQLVLATAEAGPLTVPRALVKALHFSVDGAPAVSDGAADHEIWERGLSFDVRGGPQPKSLPKAGHPWTYTGGTFALAPRGTGEFTPNRGPAIQLGRIFDTLAPRVEISFKVVGERSPASFVAHLFGEPGNPGYMLHVGASAISLSDMNPRGRIRGDGHQQYAFGPEIAANALQRHLRILADRTAGRLAIFVDGVLAAQVTPKAAAGPRELGRGIMITPQSNLPLAFSNFWVGPWNGQVPGKSAPPAAETVALTNGDEVQGTVETATPTAFKMTSEVGPLDLPTERLAMIDFGGSAVERGPGTRVQLAGQGALTASAWRLENGALSCRSVIAGQLTLPLSSVQEIVFAASPPSTKVE